MKSHRHPCAPTLAATACCTALALAALPARAQVNLVTNGSFQFSNFGPIGWNFLRSAGEFKNSFDGVASPDGGEYFGIQDLDAFSTRVNVGGITQNISGLQVGQSYTLSFWSMSNHASHDPDARQQWRVSFGGQTLSSQQTLASPTPNWVQTQLNFTASAATQALTFVADFLPGSFPEILNLDGIVLTSAPVPEPASPWLLGAGLLGIAGVVRRRLR